MKLLNSKLMLIRQLDRKMDSFRPLLIIGMPINGWINSFRLTLNMSLKQLGKRLGMSAQGVKDLEKREKEGSITLKSLREAGEAIHLNLVYGFVPVGSSLEELIEERARQIAVSIVRRTSVSMGLEDQRNSDERLKQAVEEMTQNMKREVPKSLWD